MKKVKLSGKLSLNKETVAKLNNNQMSRINGGGSLNHQSCSGCDTVFTCPTFTVDCPPVSLGGCITDECGTVNGCLTFDPGC